MFNRGFVRENPTLFSLIAKLLDIILFFFAGAGAFYFYFDTVHLPYHYLVALFFSVILVLPIFSYLNVYRSYRGQKLWPHLKLLYFAIALVMLFLVAIAFVTKTGASFSRAWFLIWTFNVIIILTLFRVGMRCFLRMMRKRGWNQRTVVILGGSDLSQELMGRIKEAVWSGFTILNLFDDNPEKIGSSVQEIIVQRIPEDLGKYIKQNRVDEVWLAFPLEEQHKIKRVLEKLSDSIVTIRYFPNIEWVDFLYSSAVDLFGIPAMSVISSPMIGINRLVKAVEDRVFAIIILMIISPLMGLVALLVKMTSPGPIFYRQQRISWNDEAFDMLKFRSMPVNVESHTGAIWASSNDGRATKFGSFLRKTSLDELPQFINVLKGDMSIVGPRPERPVFIEKFKQEIPDYMKKHLVKGGITGWAQINGWRGNTNLEKRIEFDLYYIKHWSLWFDVKIIFLTIFKGFFSKNAY